MGLGRVRKHGTSPFRVAALHGGPGAPGSVAPLARELSRDMGILEPFQSAPTVEGQIHELRCQLEADADLPVILVGWSWGAMLALMFAARHPELVSKVIMVSSAVYEKKYADEIDGIRLGRLSPGDREELASIRKKMQDLPDGNSDVLLARFGELCSKADSFDPLTLDPEAEEIPCQHDLNKLVWDEAKKLRESGQLLEMGRSVRCPVVAIHGDYDPHPVEGVEKPLSSVLSDFRLSLLEDCGHTPWAERRARDKFFEVIRREL